MESLKDKVISNSSFSLSNFVCVARNLLKNKAFVPRDKNDQVCPTALYIHGDILWFWYGFKVCSNSVSEIRHIRPYWLLLELWWRIKYLTLGQNIYQQQMKEEMKKFNLQTIFMYIHVKSPSVTMSTFQNIS